MNEFAVDPVFWTRRGIVSLGVEVIHELALRSSATTHAYKLVTGRCLLAIDETKLHETHGYSSSIHYAVCVLGLGEKEAQGLRRVAFCLESLPVLTRAAELGQVPWGKLSEIVRKASPETEAVWLAIAAKKSCREIEKLVRSTEYGKLPWDEDQEPEAPLTRLSLSLNPETSVLLERAVHSISQAAGKPMSTAEVLEHLMVEHLAKRPVSPEALEAARQEGRRRVVAHKMRNARLIEEAKELAEELGWSRSFNPLEAALGGEAICDDGTTEVKESGGGSPSDRDEVDGASCYPDDGSGDRDGDVDRVSDDRDSDADRASDDRDGDSDYRDDEAVCRGRRGDEVTGRYRDSEGRKGGSEMAPELSQQSPTHVGRTTGIQQRQTTPVPASVASSTADCKVGTTAKELAAESAPHRCEQSAHVIGCPGAEGKSPDSGSAGEIPQAPEKVELLSLGKDELAELLASEGPEGWMNDRLRYNPRARSATPAQRRELLIRDGHRCRTPGCPHRLWLELHHQVYFSKHGETVRANLLSLCSRCHSNEQKGMLVILKDAEGRLTYQNSKGEDIQRAFATERATWLNFWIGWNGGRDDFHRPTVDPPEEPLVLFEISATKEHS